MTFRDSLLALLVMAIWGFNFVVAKWGMAEFPPMFIMFLRFVVVAAVLVPFAPFPRGRLLQIFLLSLVLGTIHFPLMFNGLLGLDAATASIVAQTQVPFSSLMAAIFFKDKLGWRRAVGMAAAFAGIIVIAGQPRLSGQITPLLMILAASFAFAVASIQMKLLGDVNGFALNGWMALFALPQLLILSLILETGQIEALLNSTWRGWGAIGYMAFGVTIFAYGLWYPLLSRYAVNQTIPYLLMVPVFGVAAGVLLMDDPFTLSLVIGGLMTVGGVAIVVKRRPNTVSEKVTNPT
ncbi:EamA family transporter [Azospirillum sp. SYSU D00513]|uniref:DMT family transporter n=1 Tax=Azospirillum sp. SYSU D00513 TaxID=2812561 RepID=UPI001A963F8B|nr:EamA family transporter [Azospirillum sp. SYSU D00513]